MNSGVPWHMKGVRREVLDTAREAARRSGMSVAEWLDTVITESAMEAGVDPGQRMPTTATTATRMTDTSRANAAAVTRTSTTANVASSERDFSEVNARLDTLDQPDRPAGDTAHAEARAEPPPTADIPHLINEALSRLDRRLDQLIADGRSRIPRSNGA